VTMVDFHPARYGCTKPHRRRRIVDRYADFKRSRDRVSLRIDLPHSALCRDTGIVGQSDDHISVSRGSAQHLSRNVEDSVPAGIARDREHHLSRLHHLTGFRGAAGDRTVQARLELGIADAVLGDFDLGFGVIHRRLGRAQRLLGLIEVHACRPALLQQRVLAVEIIGILLQASQGTGKRSACGAKRVQFVLRIELCHHLVRRDAITRIHQALDDPAANTESESDFLFRLNLSRKDN